ncbi:MAG TPA: 30S ribosomal protein S4 [Candidatus Paceibacterota bacterium]|nr:30S ribosomal protein S4 [Candidatus Paceibacterota bacterium]
MPTVEPKTTSPSTKRPPFGGAAKGGAPQKRRAPKSEYGRQLEEKQKAKKNYFLSEKQFSAYVKKASEKKGVDPKATLYESLETRLDSIVYRLGLSGFSRPFARQIVSHGHILVNGVRVNIPSYHVRVGDKFSIRKGSFSKPIFQNGLKKIQEEKIFPPTWISFDYKKGEGELKGMPQMDKSEILVDLASVIEFYSR